MMRSRSVEAYFLLVDGLATLAALGAVAAAKIVGDKAQDHLNNAALADPATSAAQHEQALAQLQNGAADMLMHVGAPVAVGGGLVFATVALHTYRSSRNS